MEVCRKFMKQYTEISNLERDYEIILANPSFLNMQEQAHGLLELAHGYEREGAIDRSLQYYTRAMEKHNDLVLEAYKTAALAYMEEVKKLLRMTPTRKQIYRRAERALKEAKDAYLKAKNLREKSSMTSKVYYQNVIKSMAEIYFRLKEKY